MSAAVSDRGELPTEHTDHAEIRSLASVYSVCSVGQKPPRPPVNGLGRIESLHVSA